jgi:uncharacterized Zn-binding protein involved in type VI secretion
LDPVVHPLPGVLTPGPGSPNVLIGGKPAWRGVPAAAAAALSSAKASSDATIQAAEAATLAAAGTPGAPAAKAAEEATKAAAASAMGSTISGMAGGADIHACTTPLPLPPHGPGVVIDGSPTVLINGLPACRQGDTILEAVGPPDKILMGLPTVIIGDMAAGAAYAVAAPVLTKTPSGDEGASDTFAPGGGTPSGGGGGAAAPGSANIPSNIQIDNSDPVFAREAQEALNRFAATPTGRAVLASIGSSGKTVKIVKMTGQNGGNTPDSIADANLRPDGTPGPGSNTTVKFNPAFQPDGLPNTVVLGHELIHADHTTHGERDPRTNASSGVRNEELKTVGLPPFPASGKTENSLRHDLGLPPRTSY